MKLLKNLNQTADNCIILTFNLDLLFFEYVLFSSLYASGCRNTMVLCDPAQYQLALQHDVARLQHVGQRYLLLPARTSPQGAFHPKLILLTSSDSGKVFLLSGNLTQAGYLHNWEVLTLFEYNAKKPDPVAWQGCRWAFDTLSEIINVSDMGSLGRQRLEQLWGMTPWLHQEPAPFTTAPVWPLHNLSEPLLDQVLACYHREDGSPVSEIVAVSPFFDHSAQAIQRWLQKLQPQKMWLYFQGNGCNLNPLRLKSVLKQHQLEFQANKLSLGNRHLHAKTLLFRTEQGCWLATGSANLSRNAWLYPAANGNTEMISLRYEHDPSYFDSWLEELTKQSAPIELETLESTDTETSDKESQHRVALLSAILDQGRLVLHLYDPLPLKASLTLKLHNEETLQKTYKRWQQRDEFIILNIDPDWLQKLNRPVLVQLEIKTKDDHFTSNAALLHNKEVLECFRRPVTRHERPPIPRGLQPESYAHCAELLEMIQDLLATNKEQLDRHRGDVSPAIRKRDKQEQQQAIEEGEYDPTTHFVDEEIRHSTPIDATDLYTNFHDRLTYEELLRAVLAAVYHPAPETAAAEVYDGTIATFIVPPPPDDRNVREKMLARIERGFNRLIGNFLQGTSDDEYLTQIPPQYLTELYVIIANYLRVVWRDGMLKDDLFLDHSIDLMNAFWGQPGEPSAWQAIRPRLTNEDLSDFERRMAINAQTWFHAYVVVSHLDQKNDHRLYDEAAWMRHLKTVSSSPGVLSNLPELTYQHMWRFSQPASTEFVPASEVVNYLYKASQMYNDKTLKTEIQTWPNTKASIEIGSIAHLSQVPMLRVKFPLVNITLDLFLQTFLLFLRWPSPKQRAWVRFENANPLENEDDVKSVVIFYRDDELSLICDVVRKSGPSRPSFTLMNTTVEDLLNIQSFAEIEALANNDGDNEYLH